MTNDDTAQGPWLHFHIAGSATGGVDARALAQLLEDMTGAARVIADEKLSLGRRRGPMSRLERSLAAFRVLSVSPGSLNISLAAPPAASDEQLPMWADEALTPETVARGIVEELESISKNGIRPSGGYARRQAVERLMRSAGRIGDVVDVVHHPIEGDEVRVRVVLALDDAPRAEYRPEIQERAMFGQVFMADVEQGRQRLRVKLADDSDLTMPLAHGIAPTMPDVLGQLAELDVSETTVGGAVVDRVVNRIRLLETEQDEIDIPPKSIDELAREQGLLSRPPADYRSILAGLWATEEEAEAFRREIRQGRFPSR